MVKFLNTHRLIIMFIVINIVVGLAMNVHQSQTYTTKGADAWNNISNEQMNIIDSDDLFSSNPRVDIPIQEASLAMKIYRIIGSVGTFFKNALNPLSIPPWDFDNIIESTAATILTLIRSFLFGIMVIQTWAFFVHKTPA